VPTVENDRAASIARHVRAQPVDTRLASSLALVRAPRRVTGTGVEIAHRLSQSDRLGNSSRQARRSPIIAPVHRAPDFGWQT
jgi:hypothetical protein